MIELALLGLVGVAAVAALTDVFDDDDETAQPDEDDTLTVSTDGGPPEAVEIQSLDTMTNGEFSGAAIFEGSEADEAITLDPEYTGQVIFRLDSGGEDTVALGPGHVVNVTEVDLRLAEPDENSPDELRITFDPAVAQVLMDAGDTAETSVSADETDRIVLEFPDDDPGSLVSIYNEEFYIPSAANNSSGTLHFLHLAYVPEGVSFDADDLATVRPAPLDGFELEQLGLIPVAEFALGAEGQIRDPETGTVLNEWDRVRDAPEITSTLPISQTLSYRFTG